MKKFFALGALALAVAALSTQDASAWTNLKFGAGINFGYQAGGNNFMWGLFRNGQPPCSDNCGGGMPAPAPYGYGHQLQPGSIDQQGFTGGLTPPNGPAAAVNPPAQPQSYNRTNYTVNYQYFPYNYSYGSNYGYGYNR